MVVRPKVRFEIVPESERPSDEALLCSVCLDNLLDQTISLIAHKSLMDASKWDHFMHEPCLSDWVKKQLERSQKPFCPMDHLQIESISGQSMQVVLRQKPEYSGLSFILHVILKDRFIF